MGLLYVAQSGLEPLGLSDPPSSESQEMGLQCISVLLFLLLVRLVLWPNLWPILENILCAFEANVFSLVGCTVLCIFGFSSFTVLLNSSVSLLAF
jgi:hypothetical protein